MPLSRVVILRGLVVGMVPRVLRFLGPSPGAGLGGAVGGIAGVDEEVGSGVDKRVEVPEVNFWFAGGCRGIAVCIWEGDSG
jgi:hypothetical protein